MDDPPATGTCYLGQVLREHIENLGDDAVGELMPLGTTEGEYGRIEVCNISYHILYDKINELLLVPLKRF